MNTLTASQISILAMLATSAAQCYLPADADGHALVNANLIEVNGAVTDPNDPTRYAARITDAGRSALAEAQSSQNQTQQGFAGQSGFGATAAQGQEPTQAAAGVVASAPQTSTKATAAKPAKATPVRGVLNIAAASKVTATRNRGTMYDFDSLKAPSEMSDGNLDAFFVADVQGDKPAVEKLKIHVSSAIRDYAEVTGTKPGIKPGTTQNVYKPVRKFEIFGNPGPNGEKGAWVARTA